MLKILLVLNFLVIQVAGYLILTGLSESELRKLSILHAIVSPVQTPVFANSDACTAEVGRMLYTSLGMMKPSDEVLPAMSFEYFCDAVRGRSEVKGALETDSSWLVYNAALLRPCLDQAMFSLADKLLLNRTALCEAFTSDAITAGSLLALTTLALLATNF